MNAHAYGSVIAMEFKARPDIAFGEFVEEFNLAFQMVDSTTRTLTWDGEDVAIIDRDYVRVGLGWLPSQGKGQPWHLIIAIGCAPDEDIKKVEPASYEFLADRILDRTSEYLPATAVLRGEASQPIGPDLMDTLFDLLCADTSNLPADTDIPADVIREEDEEDYADMVETMVPPWARDDTQDEAPLNGLDETDTNEVFNEVEEKLVKRNVALGLGQTECSDPMRLTIHTLALSMCLYVPPLGAALFTYTMLRDILPVAAQAI